MFNQIKMNSIESIDFLKFSDRANTEQTVKKTGTDFYKMILEKIPTEEKSVTTKSDNDQNYQSSINRENYDNHDDERFSNSSITNNTEDYARETNELKPVSTKEVVKEESPERNKNKSEPDISAVIFNQLSDDNNLNKFIEVIRSAVAGDSKGVNDNFHKLFSSLKQKSEQGGFLNSNPDYTQNNKIYKSLNDVFKTFTKELKESLRDELMKLSRNRKSEKSFIKSGEKDLKEIALTVLNNLKKNRSREPLKHEVKTTTDDIKADKKQVLISEFSLKKAVILNDSSADKNTGGDKGQGRDSYGNSGGRTELLNSNRNDKISTAAKAMDFRENLQDIIDKAKISVRDSRNGTFTVRLNPRELGSVNVNLIMENGIITGRFIVDNEDVKSHLLSNLAELKFQLEESGISVGEFSVNVNDQRRKYLKQNDENNNVPVPVLNSEKDLLAAANQYSSNAVMHNGSINMVI